MPKEQFSIRREELEYIESMVRGIQAQRERLEESGLGGAHIRNELDAHARGISQIVRFVYQHPIASPSEAR